MMFRKLLISSLLLLSGLTAAAIWWHFDSERMPHFEEPGTIALPTPNALDIMVRAIEAIPDQNAISEAASGRPDPETGEYHDLSIAEKQQIVVANRETVSLLREALTHPLVFPDIHQVINFEGPLRLSDLRMLARLLALETEVHLVHGRFGPAMASSLDCIELGRKVGRDSVMIGVLTEFAISGIGRIHIPDILPQLSPGELEEAVARLNELTLQKTDFAKVIAQEKVIGMRLLESLFQEEGWRIQLAKAALMEHWLDVSVMWQEFEEFSLKDRTRMRLRAWRFHKSRMVSTYRQLMTEVNAALDRPFAESQHHWPTAGSSLPVFGADDFAGTFRNVWFRSLVDEVTQEILRTNVALGFHRLETGAYPDRLEALQDNLLESLPRDPFGTGGLLQYRPTETGYHLYSVGPNGADDGGRAMERPDQPDERRYLPQLELSGDIVAGVNILRLRKR